MRKKWIRLSSLNHRAGRRRFAAAGERDSVPQLSLQFASQPAPAAPYATEVRDSAPQVPQSPDEPGPCAAKDEASGDVETGEPAPPVPSRPAPSDSILRLPAVKAATGLSRSTIYDRISKGSFPAPVSLGGNVVGWPVSAINAWLERTIVGGWKAHGRRSS
jgi:prophage regulatory protein